LIERAVELLQRGRLVAFPTETVYGLGADATNPSAVARIFAAKGRPSTNPLIVHVHSVASARRYSAGWPDSATRLAERFWPGPLTIVLPKQPTIVDSVTAGLATVGLRVPDHPVALELLRAFDGAVAAPSANQSNHVSPTTAQHVRDELGDSVDLVLDGGACSVGIESTVVDLSGAIPRILRPGGVSASAIAAVVGEVHSCSRIGGGSTVLPTTPAPSPGMQERHYAPRTPAFRFLPEQRASIDVTDAAMLDITLDPAQYSRLLYAHLRMLDQQQLRAIYIELPPDVPEWAAVRDRIIRATQLLE